MKILIDSNIWRYIVDTNSISKVIQAATTSRNIIVVSPAVLYEALRTKNTEVRRSLISAMTLPNWKRLMPEAYSEAEEIKCEVKRLRPAWLRKSKDQGLYKRLRYDWIRSRGGFWDRVKEDIEGERRRIDWTPLLRVARSDVLRAREESKSMPKNLASENLNKLMATPATPINGWNGKPVDLWRLNALHSFQLAMGIVEHPYRQWLDGEIDLELMMSKPAELTSFWLHEVDIQKMQRHWLRTAFEFQQRFHKVTDGTPADSQLGTYLVDVDFMLSADKNLVRFAERCRQEAPFTVGSSILVPGGAAAIDAVLESIHMHS